PARVCDELAHHPEAGVVDLRPAEHVRLDPRGGGGHRRPARQPGPPVRRDLLGRPAAQGTHGTDGDVGPPAVDALEEAHRPGGRRLPLAGHAEPEASAPGRSGAEAGTPRPSPSRSRSVKAKVAALSGRSRRPPPATSSPSHLTSTSQTASATAAGISRSLPCR